LALLSFCVSCALLSFLLVSSFSFGVAGCLIVLLVRLGASFSSCV
jgi:hypothetical protein